MNEPKRLLEGGGTSLERSLLSALASERPSPELSRHMHQGIAFTGAVAGAKVAAAGHGALAWVGLVAAGLALGVAASQVHERQPPAPVVAPPAPQTVTQPVETAEPPAPVAPAPVLEEAAPATRIRAPGPRSGDLRDEIRMLDGARAAVRARRANDALKLLARYDRQYPNGQFRQEVLVLRVEALELAGKAQAARALGQRFLSDHPESPHAERMERVTTPR